MGAAKRAMCVCWLCLRKNVNYNVDLSTFHPYTLIIGFQMCFKNAYAIFSLLKTNTIKKVSINR
jgi:hypothetical protein